MPILDNLTLAYKGKVRETYDLPGRPDLMLLVATDALSTHDVVHDSVVPYKGKVLTALTINNDRFLEWVGIKTHLVAWGMDVYDYLPGASEDYPANLSQIGLVVKRLKMIPVEFIYRGYLTGSLYDKFYSKGIPNEYELELPAGLPLMHRFSGPIFTPTTKSDSDPPLPSAQVAREYPAAFALGLRVYDLVRERLNSVGIELIDTKFEFGLDADGRVVVADEIVTPDSSRYCLLSEICEGQNPPWLDKQIFRDEAMRMWAGGPKVPLTFSDEVVTQGSRTYLEVFEQIVGCSLSSFWAQETV